MNRNYKFSRKGIRVISIVGLGLVFFGFITVWVSYNFFDRNFFSAVLTTTCLVGCLSVLLLIGVLVYTKQKQDSFDAEFSENGERYKSIIEALNVGAWEYHSDTGYQWCSPHYYEQLGYAEKDLLENGKLNINRVWKNLLHPDDKERSEKNFDNYLLNGSQGIYDNYSRMKHKNGSWVWIWGRAKTLRNPDGTLTPITIGVHVDITEIKKLEIELIKLNEKLYNYANMNSHNVRGPVARLLGLVEVSRIDKSIDHDWFYRQIQCESESIDKILREITKELEGIETKERTADANAAHIHSLW